jgi:glycosyltransferase involved in cell wall biosynthesis
MKVSIITVCFNSGATIRDTIESVRAQTFNNIEYIVVDGGSDDDTLAIVAEYEEVVSKVVSEPDQGIYDAMNKGINLATGDVVGIINSDDVLFDNDVIARIADVFQEARACDAAYANLVYVKRNDLDAVNRTIIAPTFGLWKIRFGFIMPHPTFYARRELFSRLGNYKLNYRVAADFELMARFLLSGIRVIRIPITAVKMREGGISSNGFWWRVHQNFEIVRACRENGLYSNIFMISMKLPFKLLSFLKR